MHRSSPPLPDAFRPIWRSALVSCIGDGVTFIALPLLATVGSDKPWAAATVTVAASVGGLLMSLPAGVIADRYPARTLMVAADVFRAVLMAVLALVVLTGGAPLAFLCVIAAANAVAAPVFVNASRSLLPRVVPDRSIQVANSRLGLADIIGLSLIGPVAGGLLFTLGPSIPFAVDAATYLVSALFLRKMTSRPALTPAQTGKSLGFRDSMTGGYRDLFSDPFLRLLMVCLVVLAALQAGTFALLAPYATTVLGLGPTGYGVLLATATVGGVIGSFLANRADRIGPGRSMLIAVFLSAVGYVLFGFVATVWAAALAEALDTLAAVLGVSVVHTAYQRRVPEGRVGRAAGAVKMTGMTAAAAGAVIAGLTATYSLTVFMAAGAVVCAGLGVGVARSALRLGPPIVHDDGDPAEDLPFAPVVNLDKPYTT